MTAATTSVDLTGQPYKERSMRSMIWRHFRRHHMAMVGVIVLACMIFGVSLQSPGSALMIRRRAACASVASRPVSNTPWARIRLGRDMFTRILYGGRISLSIGLMATVVGVTIGTLIGSMSGYYGGATSTIC